MNQRGNEPMVITHIRIPQSLNEEIRKNAEEQGISLSEYTRLALEYVCRLGIPMASKTTWKDYGAD